MQENKHTFCVNPYLNISIHPSGVVKPCCMSNKEYRSDLGEKYLNKSSVMELWNSSDRLKMIKDLDSGIKVEECESCWKEEDAGIHSKRLRDNEIYKDKLLSDNMLPIVADFSLGNLCNLRCRICKPIHSSQWMNEEASNYRLGKIAYLKDPTWNTVKQSFIESNDLFWKDILNLLPNVERFDFAGGEPFYIEKHWDIIKQCVDQGWSKKQHVHYNTNGTIYPEKHIDLLNKFKIVDIQISTDGIYEKFEYLRDLANWDIVEENIQKFIKTSLTSETEWRFSMCLSISAFNVFDFFETYEYYSQKGIGIYVNIVHDHSSASVLPDLVKSKVIEHLNSFKKYSDRRWLRERDAVCSYMQNTKFNDSKWQAFKENLKELDGRRNQSFKDTFPEYWNLMKEFI